MKRIRGAVGVGLTWGAAWLGAGLLMLLVVGLDAADVPFPLFFGLLGFIAGTLFSFVLAAVEQRRSFEQLSIPRVAGWGAVGGLLLSGLFFALSDLGTGALMLAPIFSGAGATCAAGTLALARRGTSHEALPSPDDTLSPRQLEAE